MSEDKLSLDEVIDAINAAVARGDEKEVKRLDAIVRDIDQGKLFNDACRQWEIPKWLREAYGKGGAS